MNRNWIIDSKLSLDAEGSKSDSSPVITQPYRLYVERTDRRQNMARFYALAIERTLFGEICLIRRWGRIGARGQELSHYFENERDAVLLFLDLARRKRYRGYSPIKSTRAVGL